MQSTSVRVDADTHRELKRLAASLGVSVRTESAMILLRISVQMRLIGLMLTSGDAVDLDLGVPASREAGFRHPAVVVTAQRILDASPSVVQVVLVSSTLRGFASEVEIEADDHNALKRTSAAQCQDARSVSVGRIEATRGNVGAAVLVQIQEVLGLILEVHG